MELPCADFLDLKKKYPHSWRGNKDYSEGLLLKPYHIISWLHLYIQPHASHCHSLLVSARLIHSFHKATKAVYLSTAGTERKHCSYYMCSCTFTCTLSSSHSVHSIMVIFSHLCSAYRPKKKHITKLLTIPDFSMLVHGPSIMLWVLCHLLCAAFIHWNATTFLIVFTVANIDSEQCNASVQHKEH